MDIEFIRLEFEAQNIDATLLTSQLTPLGSYRVICAGHLNWQVIVKDRLIVSDAKNKAEAISRAQDAFESRIKTMIKGST